MSLVCNGTLTTSNQGYADCSVAWIQTTDQDLSMLLSNVVTSLDSLNLNLDYVFKFDNDIFGTVLLASILSFITGHVTGVVIRHLSK